MNKTKAFLASSSVIAALALSLVAPVGAQTYGDTTGTNNSTVTTASSTTNTSGTMNTSGSASDMSSSTNPGLPNTGAGGDAAMNFAILLSTGLLAVGGSVLVARKLAA